jgi:hypothetical protein
MLVSKTMMSKHLNCWEAHCLWEVFNANLALKAGERIESQQEHLFCIGTPTYGRVWPQADECSIFYIADSTRLGVWLPLGFIPYDLKFLKINFHLYSYWTTFDLK